MCVYYALYSSILSPYSPGMPEMLTPSAALVGSGLGTKVALVTDGRFSGATHGIHTCIHTYVTRHAYRSVHPI